MRLALWTPYPEEGWVAAVAPHLAREIELVLVDAEPPSAPEADLHVYHVADTARHGFVYRALLRQPGVVVLEEWSLHRLVHAETVGRGDEEAYRREARHAHGETGTFVARQVLRGLGGALPALLAMNDRVLEASLGLAATSAAVRERAGARLTGRPVVQIPLAFVGLTPLPTRAGARGELGLGQERAVVVALRGAADTAPAPGIARALERVAAGEPGATVLWTTEDDPGLALRLAAADVVVALEHPVRLGVPAAVARATAGGRCTLVTAGSGAACELAEAGVVRVPPGRREAEEVEAWVRRLLTDASARARRGEAASAWAAERGEPGRAARGLLALVREVAPRRDELIRAAATAGGGEGSLLAWAMDDVRVAARELGLEGATAELEPLLADLFGGHC